jgi:hypothetical protein
MNETIFRRNELLAAKVAKGIASRYMEAFYAPSREAALAQVLALIPENATVAMRDTTTCRTLTPRYSLSK